MVKLGDRRDERAMRLLGAVREALDEASSAMHEMTERVDALGRRTSELYAEMEELRS